MKILIGPNPMGLEALVPALREQYPDTEVAYCPEREDLPDLIADAEIYLGWLDREMFLAADNLVWIQSPSSGVNHFLDIPELAEGDVLLTSAVGTHGEQLADSVLGMILAHTRGIRAAVGWQQDHEWTKVRRYPEMRGRMVELTGSTMGIVGFGTSGRATARRAAGFGMDIIAVDLYTDDKPDHVRALWSPERLPDLLAQADYVVITVPYTAATDGMIGPDEIGQMKPTAMLVCVSRGRIIDEDAMLAALRDGRLAAAALDVCAEEPLPADSELWEVDNLLITPHIAGISQFEGERVTAIFRENLARFMRGERPLRNEVDKRRGF